MTLRWPAGGHCRGGCSPFLGGLGGRVEGGKIGGILCLDYISMIELMKGVRM